MRLSRARLALLAIVALLALAGVAPATAAAKTHRLGAGTATFSLDPQLTGDLLQAGIAPYPIFPARISWGLSSVTLRMPVTGGTWTTGTAAHGTFLLAGGLAYVARGITNFIILNVKGWRAGVNTTPGISVSVNGTRTPNFLDEDLAGMTQSIVTVHGQKFVKVTGVGLDFGATSANEINDAFDVALAPLDPFGTATFLARLRS